MKRYSDYYLQMKINKRGKETLHLMHNGKLFKKLPNKYQMLHVEEIMQFIENDGKKYLSITDKKKLDGIIHWKKFLEKLRIKSRFVYNLICDSYPVEFYFNKVFGTDGRYEILTNTGKRVVVNDSFCRFFPEKAMRYDHY